MLDADSPSSRLTAMERTVRVFRSFEDAEQADIEGLSRMSPQERLDRALALIARHREAQGATGQGLARVARVVPFERR